MLHDLTQKRRRKFDCRYFSGDVDEDVDKKFSLPCLRSSLKYECFLSVSGKELVIMRVIIWRGRGDGKSRSINKDSR